MNTHVKTKRQPKKVSKKSIALKKLIKNKAFKYLYLSFHRWEINTKNNYEKDHYEDNQDYVKDYENDTDENNYKNNKKSSRKQSGLKLNTYTESKTSKNLNQIFSPNKEILNNRNKDKKFVIEWGTGSIKRTVKKDYEKTSKKKKSKVKTSEDEIISLTDDSTKKKTKMKLESNIIIENEFTKKTKKENMAQYYKDNFDDENSKNDFYQNYNYYLV